MTLHVNQIVRRLEKAAAPKPEPVKGPREVQPEPPPSPAPTPERLAHAGDAYSVSKTGVMRVTGSQLDRMHMRKHLSSDRDLSALMFMAGERFLADWYRSGLSGPSGIDFNAPGGGSGHPAYSIPSSERVAGFRAMWRQAYRAIGDADQQTVVGMIVLDDCTATDAGIRVTGGMCSPRKARDVAMDLLRKGLITLAKHYGLEGA